MARCFGRDVRQVHFGLLAGRELDLRLLGRLLQALHGERVAAHVHARLLLELGRQVVNDALVEVLAAEERVAVGRQHLELALAVHVGELDDGNVERAAAEVVHGHLAVTARLVEAVGQRGRGGLVDDALDGQPGNLTGVLGRLALRVVEVRRHRDHGLGHRLAEEVLGGLLHLHEHARRDLGRRHLLAVHLDPGVAVVGLGDLVRHHVDVLLHDLVVVAAADQALDRVQRVLWVGDRLALGGLPDQHLVVLGEGDDRGGGAVTLAVLDHARLAAVHDRDARVGGAEVDADDSCHGRDSVQSGIR
jgi:hypothetical protein